MHKPRFLLMLLTLIGAAGVAHAADNWVAGTNYFVLPAPQPTAVAPGKVAVTEVFSFACPACDRFYPIMERLKETLPANAQVDYLPASFNPSEDWPVFQRAYFAAEMLGIEARTHAAMFDAVWKTGELRTIDLGPPPRLHTPAPTIEDVARYYAHVAGVTADQFLKTANSFGVDVKMREADRQIKAMQVDQTPTVVVAGKYRLTVASANGENQLIALVKYLVAKESPGTAAAKAH